MNIESEKTRTLRALRKRLKRIHRGIQEKQKALDACKSVQALGHQAELLKANMHLIKPHTHELIVQDWNTSEKVSIPLNPKKSPDEQVKALFQKVKKLKIAPEPLQKALLHLEQEKTSCEEHMQKAAQAQTLHELKQLQQAIHLFARTTKKSKEPKNLVEAHTFLSTSGFRILVGKNSTANDQLTFQVAKKDDLWLHIHQESGSHVIVQMHGKEQVDEETLLDAATLAIYFSKRRADRGIHDVLVTKRQHVMKPKGAKPGLVHVRDGKIVRIRIDPERINRLKISR
jgi:predicted ribosome quality control (RQC) complex YloA/Tae2 family protein